MTTRTTKQLLLVLSSYFKAFAADPDLFPICYPSNHRRMISW
ncbi:hypothetical protein SLEP1_g47400 [Rubroshorea leprosula]|uniref:Uncharacterized protein n=1 Tax=Rubroshorea leprosula TaxID=152421 RepID=A0AAV5LR69_9ROSI|nr:hypothetical protein SLEP1_g47400 [Rubroshorea leprosula]